MPAYRFIDAQDAERHVVVAKRCVQVGPKFAFYDVTMIDQPLHSRVDKVALVVTGEVEVVA